MNPMTSVNGDSRAPDVMSVPTRVIPEIALAPDIRGVCNRGGTFVMTSNPITRARRNIVNAGTKVSINVLLLYK
jgi:hypothetical protein